MSVYDDTDLAYRDDAREDACRRATGHRRTGVHESWRGRFLQCLDCDTILGPAPKAWRSPRGSAKKRHRLLV